MATVRMKKGNVYADVFDSPEEIQSSIANGWTLVETQAPAKAEKTEEKPLFNEAKAPSRSKRL